jgi:hypothetical protein
MGERRIIANPEYDDFLGKRRYTVHCTVAFLICIPETLTKRQATQHGCLPASWAIEELK